MKYLLTLMILASTALVAVSATLNTVAHVQIVEPMDFSAAHADTMHNVPMEIQLTPTTVDTVIVDQHIVYIYE